MQLGILRAAGSAQALGYSHGQTYRHAIRRFAAERVALAGDALWVGRDMPRSDVLALAESCLAAHRAYAPTLSNELEAMADAAGLTTAEMLIVSGFTDFMDVAHAAFSEPGAPATDVDDCTAMIVPGSRTKHGAPLFAQTWDMHETATEHVFVYEGRPDHAPAFTTFTSMGCLGMIGMNEAGITLGINNLSGADGRVGVTWNFVVRKVLAQTNIDDALACIVNARLAGAHNYLLVGADGRGANIEATATQHVITPLGDTPLVHTNHCLAPDTQACERPRLKASQINSEKRLARAQQLLARQYAVDVEQLMTLTRDTQAICYPPTPKLRMTTCGAVVADPARRTLWALRGRPSEQTYQAYSPGD